MPDTLPSIALPKGGAWVDLYAGSGITVGSVVSIQSLSASDVNITSLASPVPGGGYQILTKGSAFLSDNGSTGLWARSQTGGSVSVAEVIGQGITSDAWGKDKVALDVSLFHGLFSHDIPPSQWLLYEDGVENINPTTWTAASSVGGALVLSSEGGTRSLVSRRHPRYQPNRGIMYSNSMWFPSKNAGAIRDVGIFTDDDGLYFRLKKNVGSGLGELFAIRESGGVIENEELIAIPFQVDFEKGNIYDIQAQYRGVGDVSFFIGNPLTGKSQLVHKMKLLGAMNGLSTEDGSMCVNFRTTKVTEDADIQCGCVDLSSEGGGIDREQYGSAFGAKTGVTLSVDTPILVIRQPLEISGKFNSRDIRIARVTGSTDKRATFSMWVTRDASAIAGATFEKLNAFGSFVESDSPDVSSGAVRATSVDTAKMQFITTFRVLANDSKAVENPSKDSIDFFLVQGDYLVITANPDANAAIDAAAEWGEEL